MSKVPDQPPEEAQPEPVSLEKLSEAFAEAFARGPGGPGEDQQAEDDAEVEATPPDEEGAPERLPSAQDDEGLDEGLAESQPPASPDDACPISPVSLLEAMLFVGSPKNEPLAAEQAAGWMRDVEPGEIATLVERLNRRYDAAACPYRIVSDGPGFRLVLRPTFRALQDRFHGRLRTARLSQAAVDVLAIAAYRQGATSEEVSRLRGRPSGHLLSQLVRRRLLRVERSQTKPRISRYFTTDRFLKLFRLQGLEDLPQCEDLPQPVP
jgi:segregation and condensation protein B